MSEKNPQPTAVLIERLRRAARVFDGYAKDMREDKPFRERKAEAWTAFANTCLQAAGRLEAADDEQVWQECGQIANRHAAEAKRTVGSHPPDSDALHTSSGLADKWPDGWAADLLRRK